MEILINLTQDYSEQLRINIEKNKDNTHPERFIFYFCNILPSINDPINLNFDKLNRLHLSNCKIKQKIKFININQIKFSDCEFENVEDSDIKSEYTIKNNFEGSTVLIFEHCKCDKFIFGTDKNDIENNIKIKLKIVLLIF